MDAPNLSGIEKDHSSPLKGFEIDPLPGVEVDICGTLPQDQFLRQKAIYDKILETEIQQLRLRHALKMDELWKRFTKKDVVNF